jgi:hypothetical protein
MVNHHHPHILAGRLPNHFIFSLKNQLAHTTGQMDRLCRDLHRLLDHRRTTTQKQERDTLLPAR